MRGEANPGPTVCFIPPPGRVGNLLSPNLVFLGLFSFLAFLPPIGSFHARLLSPALRESSAEKRSTAHAEVRPTSRSTTGCSSCLSSRAQPAPLIVRASPPEPDL